MSGIFQRNIFQNNIFQVGSVAAHAGGGFRHIGRKTRDEWDELDAPAYTVATSEALPVKPPSRKMRKRLAIAAKANPVEDEEEEAFMMLLAA
jgi:hypothetical protein